MNRTINNIFVASIINLLTVLSLQSFAQMPNTWTQKSDFGGGVRSGACAFGIGNKGYMGTGYIGSGSQRFKDFWEYDPLNNTWSQKADFGSTVRYYATGFSIGNKGYITCGNDNVDPLVGGTTKDIWEYDPVNNVWTQKTPFPGMARMAAVGFSIGSKGYFGTGEHIIGSWPNQIVTRVNDFWEFDPAGSGGMGTWTEKTKINNDVNLVRAFAVGFSIGNKGYVGTGHNALNGMYKDFWEYDPSLDSWTPKTDFFDARWQAIGISIGAYGYLGLGDGKKDFWEYNPNAGTDGKGTWTQKTGFSENRSQAAGFVIGNKLYIGAGGYNQTDPLPRIHYKDFYEYTPAAIWSGATNNNWDLTTNWQYPSVPTVGTNVIIPANLANYPIIGGAALCYNLTINSGSGVNLTIAAGKSLTVNGTLVNYAGTTGLVVKSENTGTGSLIHTTAGVNATVERYITAANWTNAENGWHLLSSPVTNQAISGAWTPSGTNNDYDFYVLKEASTTGYWLNQKVSANNITSFIPGKGYLVAYQQTGSNPRTFTGPINTSDVTLSGLTNTTTSAYPGFHLVGNPFPCAINWNSGSWTKTNIDVNAYVWENQLGAYTSTAVSGKNIIPSMNGFMVRVNLTAGGTLKIPSNSRLIDATNWYKSSENEMILFKANDIDRGLSQSSIVRFNPLATTEFDTEFDSYFASGFAPMFYSVTSGNNLLLNTLPEISENLVIPFTFIKNSDENFTIELVKSLPGISIYLEDIKSNSLQNLTENPVYKFTSAESDDPSRFKIHFQDLTIPDQETFRLYQSNGNIYITTIQTVNSEIMVSNMLGQVVLRAKTNGNPLTMLNANSLQNGVYIVSLAGNSKVMSKKIVISK